MLTPPTSHNQVALGTTWALIHSLSWPHLNLLESLVYLCELESSSVTRVRKQKISVLLQKIKICIFHEKEVQGEEAAPHSSETQLPPSFPSIFMSL